MVGTPVAMKAVASSGSATTGLAVDHRQSQVRAAGADQAVERAGRKWTNNREVGRRARCQLSGGLRAQQVRRACGYRAGQAFGAQLPGGVCRLQLIEQIALTAQSRVTTKRQPIGVVKRANIGGGVEEKLIRRWAPDQAGTGVDHAIGRGAAKGHAVDEHAVGGQAAEPIECLELALRRLIQALRPRGSSTATRAASADATSPRPRHQYAASDCSQTSSPLEPETAFVAGDASGCDDTPS